MTRRSEKWEVGSGKLALNLFQKSAQLENLA